MPEKNDEKAIDVVDKNKNCLNYCDNIRLGQIVKVFIGDVLVFDEAVTEENINKIRKYVCNGCKYYTK